MRIICAITLLVFAGAAMAQQAAPVAAPQPDKVVISLSGVTLHSVVAYISEFTGKPVILPPRFPGDQAVGIVSSSRAGVPKEKSLEILGRTLRSAGFAMVEYPDHIQIVPEGSLDGVPVGEIDATGLAAQTLKTVDIRIRNADAAKLMAILTALKSKAGNIQVYPEANKLVITEYGSQLKIMQDLIQRLDTAEPGAVTESYPLTYASVTSLLSAATNYVKNLSASADPIVRKRLENLSIYSHEPTNTFILFGHSEDLKKVKELLAKLDVPPNAEARSYHVYPVLHRGVDEMVEVVMGVFSATKTKDTADIAPQVIPDKINSSLIIIAPPDRYAQILPLLQELDRPKAQVLIEAALVEVSTEKLVDLGVEFATLDAPSDSARGFAGSTFGLSTITTSGRVPVLPSNGGLTAGIFKDSVFNVAALIRLSEVDDDVAFIAAPQLMASDNRPAQVEIAEEREYQKSIVTPEGRTSEVTHGGYLKASTLLDITPHINEEGTVRLEIKQVTEQFLPSTETETGQLTNKISRTATTEVVVPNARTVVIAGLTRTVRSKTIQKVPVLGSIPLIKYLFRRTVDTEQQRNLCIFITPYVLGTPEALSATAEMQRDELLNLKTREVPIPTEVVKDVTGGRQWPTALEKGPAKP